MSKEGDKKRMFHKTSSFGPVINRHIDSFSRSLYTGGKTEVQSRGWEDKFAVSRALRKENANCYVKTKENTNLSSRQPRQSPFHNSIVVYCFRLLWKSFLLCLPYYIKFKAY